MLKEIKDAFKGKLIDYEIQGPAFQYNSNTYEAKIYLGDSFEEIANEILNMLDSTEGFAIYEIRKDLIRGAILPLQSWVIEVKPHPELNDELVVEFPAEMMKKLKWQAGDTLDWSIDQGKIIICKIIK